MSREQMGAAGYGFHHESEDGKYLIMANGSRAFAIPNGDTPEHTAPEKLTVLVVEPMKEPYVKEIDPGLRALQAEVGGDIAASYPFDDPVGLVLNDEGNLRKVRLVTSEVEYDFYGKISDVVKQLDGNLFLQIHNSYIVNMSQIRKISDSAVVLKSGVNLPISKKYRDEVRQKHIQYMAWRCE